MSSLGARTRVKEYLRQFDRLRDTGGVIHGVHTDPEAEPVNLTSKDLHAIIEEESPSSTTFSTYYVARTKGGSVWCESRNLEEYTRQCALWDGPEKLAHTIVTVKTMKFIHKESVPAEEIAERLEQVGG